MQRKLWIGLEGMEFHAHHGVYDEERLKGGRYVVDVQVCTDAQRAELYDELEGTVNYERIYATARQQMERPVKLIEHLARNILNELRTWIPKDDVIKIRIRKLNPPLSGKVAASVVEITDAFVR
jgi:dihydroneopterin aldolase